MRLFLLDLIKGSLRTLLLIYTMQISRSTISMNYPGALRSISWFFIGLLLAFVSHNAEANVCGELRAAEREKQFDTKHLDRPQENKEWLVGHFSYHEVDTFSPKRDALTVHLENGYAQARFRHPEVYTPYRSGYRVKKVKIVFTKYPYHKEDWRTNYYDLLAWRLQALFDLDSLLNDASAEWSLVLQTSGKTEPAAKNLFHGIVLQLKPMAHSPEVAPPYDRVTTRVLPEPIQRKGWTLQRKLSPDFHRSRFILRPQLPPRQQRNMQPSDLECPTWN